MTTSRRFKSAPPPSESIPHDAAGNSPAMAAQVNFGYEPVSALEAVSAQDMAAYIADMLLELRELAQEAGFETLGRVLEIAEREAKWRMEERVGPVSTPRT